MKAIFPYLSNVRSALLVMLIIAISSCENVQPVQEATGLPDPDKVAQDEAMQREQRLGEEHALFREAYADSVNMGLIEKDSFTGSARRESRLATPKGEIVINYGSPGKRGRVLWNGLVSYDQVWVSGSHWATALTFPADVSIDGQRIPAGTYAFFTIPGREKWTLIVNENFDQHLAEDYEEELDLIRLEVDPIQLSETVQRLTYGLDRASTDSVMLSLSWDQLRVNLPIKLL